MSHCTYASVAEYLVASGILLLVLSFQSLVCAVSLGKLQLDPEYLCTLCLDRIQHPLCNFAIFVIFLAAFVICISPAPCHTHLLSRSHDSDGLPIACPQAADIYAVKASAKRACDRPGDFTHSTLACAEVKCNVLWRFNTSLCQ